MRRLPVPRTLRARLTTGLVVLVAAVCAAVGLTTVPALRGFLLERLDQQLVSSGGRFAASLEHEARPDEDNAVDTRGQPDHTFGARLLDGTVTATAVVHDESTRPVPLDAADRAALAALPADEGGRTLTLSALGSYRVVAVPGDDRDVLVTGLPMHGVDETVAHLRVVEGVVFGAALLATAAAGYLWIRLALRPLDRVAATATEVTRLPLASGEVAMPEPVPDTDTGTEVGRVGAALNQLLGHVGVALARRQASAERLREFAADAGHELRTPVANVRGHAELALRRPGPLPPDVRRSLERVVAESARMSALVDDLLLLARLDSDRPLAREVVDLSRMALDAVDDARAIWPSHHWLLDLPEDPLLTRGDGQRLHQVVTNLLANAASHTPPGTEVTLRLVAAAEDIVLTVTDDGPGIAPDLLPKVFARFTRGDHGRSRAGGNTGLGLSIVASVTRAHGGSVDVTSRPGHTVFRVLLPWEGDGRGTGGPG
ncbi:sensor histidine kinase [Streptomyces xiamenensis]|uniref:histidine kinase n=1 Tax=Streptomyces xiamenensis TaxID=408015 RepID=A0A0F7G276_9ACTN|nr:MULTISPECIES: HAMP domain-containing sensor histidine kinase [Streptomyces]AKG46657.1 two component sensor kinase [Streptomyces xiamenensis]